MRHLRWIGVMSSLLFVGVLGGLMAPLSSEAAPPTLPTLSIKIDGAELAHTSGSFLNTASSTCSASDVTLGFNFCYAINTSTTLFYNSAQVKVPAGTGTLQPVRQYKIVNFPGATARLRVSDKSGQDGFSLAGMVIAPVLTNWTTLADNAGEEHILTIAMTGHFDATTDPTSTPTPNAPINGSPGSPPNAGTYVWAMRTGGEFGAQPVYPATNPAVNCTVNTNTASASYNPDGHCDAIRDSATFTGKGTFSTANTDKDIVTSAAPNAVALSFTVKAPHASPDVHWDGLDNTDMGQVNPTYPSFDCRNDYGSTPDSTRCTPTITLTMVASLKGPDKLTILNGNEAFCALCSAMFSTTDTKLLKFDAGLDTVLKFLRRLPFVQNHPKLLAAFNLEIARLDLTLNAASQPVTACPEGGSGQGAAIVATHLAAGAGIDLQITSTDGSAVGEPAPQNGTIVITKTTETNMEDDHSGAGPFPINQAANLQATFNFTGVGKEITDFNITTAAGLGGQSFNGLTTGVGGERTISETGFPDATIVDPDAEWFGETGASDASWFTKDVSCVSTLTGSNVGTLGPTLWTPYLGIQDQPYPTTDNRSGFVTVSNLAEGDTLTCTFKNGIYEPGE
jgi:hypothetical protein